MPADLSYPERGYLAGGQASALSEFEMDFKLPDKLVGSEVLLQVSMIEGSLLLSK